MVARNGLYEDINGVRHKECSICKKMLPLNIDYFQKNGPTRCYGFSAACKECGNKARRDRWTTEKGRILRERYKDYLDLYGEINKERMLENKRRYCRENRERLRVEKREYYQNNKELVNRRNKEYVENNIERVKEYRKAYWTSDRGKEVSRRATHIRKYRKRNALLTLTYEQWEECKNYFNSVCAYCGKEVELTQDHVIPLSNGGSYTKQNIIPCCKSCNCSKQNSDMETWYMKQDYFDIHKLKLIHKWIGFKKGYQQLSMM